MFFGKPEFSKDANYIQIARLESSPQIGRQVHMMIFLLMAVLLFQAQWLRSSQKLEAINPFPETNMTFPAPENSWEISFLPFGELGPIFRSDVIVFQGV